MFRAEARLPGLTAAAVRAVVARAWRLYAGPVGARLEVVLLGDREHSALHDRLLGDPSSTDVMALPYGDLDLFGEILVNRDVARKEARRRRRPAADEALLYVVHGALHLIGFRDDGEDARAEMRAAEARVLAGD